MTGPVFDEAERRRLGESYPLQPVPLAHGLSGHPLFTLEAHVRYLDQVPPGARLEVRSSVIGVTGKLLWLWHEMWSEERLRATEEALMVHVDTAAGRASPFPDDLRARAEALLVPPPEQASRRIAVG